MDKNNTTTMVTGVINWKVPTNFTINFGFDFGSVFEDQLNVTKFGIIPIAILTIIFNAIGLTIFFVARRRMFQKLNNFHLFSIMLSDFFAGVFGANWHFSLIFLPAGHTRVLPPTLYFTAIIENFLMVALFSLDRLCAVTFPFWYQQITIKFFLKTVLVVQVIPVGFFIALLTQGSTQAMISLFLLIQVIAGILLTFSNIVVYRIAQKQYKKIKKTIVVKTQQEYTKHMQEIKRKQINSIWLCLVFVVCFIACWLPLSLNFVVNSMQHKGIAYSLKRTIFLFISSLNPLLGPIINFMLITDLRHEMGKFFNRRKITHVTEITVNSKENE